MKDSASVGWLINLITVGVVLFAADRFTAHGGTLGTGIFATCSSLLEWMVDSLLVDSYYTLTRVLLGFGIAAFLGVFVGLFTGRLGYESTGLVQTLNYLRAITPVALAPFFLVAFGINEISKILLISWGAFFPIWVSAHLGVKA